MRSRDRRGVRFAWMGLALACLVAGASRPIRAQSRNAFYRAAEGSPLATDGFAFFGVATDGRALLVSTSGADWPLVARRPTPGRISGLAWDRGVLSLSDEETRGIYSLSLDPVSAVQSGSRPPETARPVLQGGQLQRPRDLAFAGGALLVADPAARTVWRIDVRE